MHETTACSRPKESVTEGKYACVASKLEIEFRSVIEIRGQTVTGKITGVPRPFTNAKRNRFLGYDPLPRPATMAERLPPYRRANGLKVKDVAALAGEDRCNWSSWERENHEMTRTSRERIEKMIGGADL